MRKRLSVLLFTTALALLGRGAAFADTTFPLTGGTMQFSFGDPGSASLLGDGFEMTCVASGGWPVSFKPGDLVNFSTDVQLSSWGTATVNGAQIPGDPTGPGTGRLWITGTMHVVAVPFIAPASSEFTGAFFARVTLTGSVTAYFNTDVSQTPVAISTVSGSGTAGGTYRLVDSGSDQRYLNNCCVSIAINAPTEQWTYGDIGAVGLPGSASQTFTSGQGEVFSVRSAGADIWASADSFGYLHTPFLGDGWISVGVLSVQPTNAFAKAGLMLRESLDPSSAFVIMDVRPNGQTEFMTRSTAGGATQFAAGSTETLPTWLALYRNGSVVTGYVFGDGWRKTIGSTTITMGQKIFVGAAVTSHDASTLNTVTFGPPVVHNYTFGLPRGWNDSDIGVVGLPGGSSYDAGTFAVRGAGADIWSAADAFHFVSQTLTGASQIVARVTGVGNTNPFGKAGIMMRLGSLGGASDSHVILDVRPTGDIEFMTRSGVGQSTTFIASISRSTPIWLKLAWSGTTISGFTSADGLNWTLLGSADPNFAEMNAAGGHVQAGLAVSSHDASALSTSTFDNVSIGDGSNPAALPRFWSNRDVGDTGEAGSAAYAGGIFTVRGSGADIWGTTDAFQQVSQRFDSDAVDIAEYPIQHAEVTARVTSITNTTPFAKAGVMIRDSEAPGAAHVLLDVRPTGDVEFMTRVSTGGPTTYVGGTKRSLPVWVKLIRSGAIVAGYVSTDGANWTSLGSVTTALSKTTTQVGPVVTSHQRGQLNTVTFDHVDVRIPQ